MKVLVNVATHFKPLLIIPYDIKRGLLEKCIDIENGESYIIVIVDIVYLRELKPFSHIVDDIIIIQNND
jgi:hypothetical protein